MTTEQTAEGPTLTAFMTVFGVPLCDVFAEWDRQYRADPTAFYSTVERLLAGESVETYGERAAATLVGIAREVHEARKGEAIE